MKCEQKTKYGFHLNPIRYFLTVTRENWESIYFSIYLQFYHLGLGNLAKLVFWSILSFKNWKVNTYFVSVSSGGKFFCKLVIINLVKQKIQPFTNTSTNHNIALVQLELMNCVETENWNSFPHLDFFLIWFIYAPVVF